MPVRIRLRALTLVCRLTWGNVLYLRYSVDALGAPWVHDRSTMPGMAYIVGRKNASGEVTSYQVKWRQGGARSGPVQLERFDDEASARVFQEAVNAAEQQWPPGWVKGRGFIDPSVGDESRYRFETYARASVANRTGVGEHYRAASVKELETYVFPTFGNCDVRSPEHFCKATIGAWVNRLAVTMVRRGSKRHAMSPKTIANIHGLLSSILKEAVREEPSLRAQNPCDETRLTRTDDEGLDDEGLDESMTFLLPAEVQAIVEQLPRAEDKALILVKYATGFRWGEITALTRRHAVELDGRATLRVSRAWKRRPGEGFYIGAPKSKRSRRTIRVTASTWETLREHGLETLKPGDLLFHNGQGERLRYSSFYDRWMAAVARAHEAGTLPEDKHPTLHDLRHSHAAALLSAGRGLTYVQRRLGHESITTTSDRYGHLLPEADDDAMETIEESLAGGRSAGHIPTVISSGDGRRVYAAHLGEHSEAFWDLDVAQAVAEQWTLDTDRVAHVEAWTTTWCQGRLPGGVRGVRHRAPDRMQVWHVGPTFYSADGTETVRRPQDHEPRTQWVWEWETWFTDDPAVSRTEWCGALTEAQAWGRSRDAVVGAYAQARVDALRVCGLNPAGVMGRVQAL